MAWNGCHPDQLCSAILKCHEGQGSPRNRFFYTKCALGKQETASVLTQSSWLKREFESEMCTTVNVPHRKDIRENCKHCASLEAGR